jgi:hypothetical protein
VALPPLPTPWHAAAMTTIDFEVPRDRAAELAGKPGSVRFLELLPVRAVMVDGEGAAGGDAFGPLLPGLYGTAYGLRFALKKRGIDEKAGVLEGRYWTASGTTVLDDILGEDRGDWRWTLHIVLPAAATDAEIETALEAARRKMDPAAAGRVRVGTIDEGRVAQVLHVGPYSAERPTIEALHAAIEAAGLRPRDAHHEIYLGDPNRSAPERLRTILRHPVEPATVIFSSVVVR